jgi:RNA-directed DNA polymerase
VKYREVFHKHPTEHREPDTALNDFLGFSYGFRPGRSQHNALDALYVGINQRKVNWILDMDLEKFFDRVEHDWLIYFIEHRIADQRIINLLIQWISAGHMDT